MPKCDFNKIVHTSARVFCKFTVSFQKHIFLKTHLHGCFWQIIWPFSGHQKLKNKTKTKTKMKIITKLKNKSKKENENKNKNKSGNENKNENEKQWIFVFVFILLLFLFLLFKRFCIFVNSTWPRGVIDGQLSLDWSWSAIAFSLNPRGSEVP